MTVSSPRRAFCLTLLVLGVASRLSAQHPADTTRLGDLVVTATRAPSHDTAIPAATTVIRGDELRARGIGLVTDALREVPGMMLVQTGSYGAVTALFLRGGEGDYVKVLLDGVTLNQPGGGFNFANLTTDNLDRIEIVRGPASVLYGADAMSGVVQLFTRNGSGRLHGDATVTAGTFGNRDGELHLAGGQGALTISTSASSFRSDGLYDFNSDYRNRVASVRVGLDGGQVGSAAFTLRAGNALGHYPTDGNGLPVDHNQYTADRTTVLGLDLQRAVTTQLRLTAQLGASRVYSDAFNPPDGPADTVGFGFDADRTGGTLRRNIDLRADWTVRPDALVSVGSGIEHESEDQQSRTVSNFGTGPFTQSDEFTANRNTRNVYAQLLARPLAPLSLQVGARLDDNSAFGTFSTWRVGASWELAHHTRVYGAAGTAFKAPTFSELFAASAFEVGNRALRPERSRNLEIGIEQQVAGSRMVLTATLFSQRFRDLIQYVGAAPGEPTYNNLGETRAHGLEAGASWRPIPSLGLRAHWSWLRTEVTDTGSASSVVFAQGQRLLRRPASSGGLTVLLGLGSATVGAGVGYVGARDDADFRDFPAARTTLPSYTLVDLSLDAPIRRSRSGVPGIDLTFRAENLLDTRWSQAVGFPGRGRTLIGGARLHF
ncbi:MAG: TonB-dependent receptor [Gemmatimonadota bacterium]